MWADPSDPRRFSCPTGHPLGRWSGGPPLKIPATSRSLGAARRKRMHLAIDCRCIHAHMGGIGRAAWELVRELAANRRDHQLTLLVGSKPPQGFEIPRAQTPAADRKSV